MFGDSFVKSFFVVLCFEEEILYQHYITLSLSFFSVYPLRYLGFYFDTLLKRKYFTHIPDLRGFIVGVYYGCQIEEVPGTTNV